MGLGTWVGDSGLLELLDVGASAGRAMAADSAASVDVASLGHRKASRVSHSRVGVGSEKRRSGTVRPGIQYALAQAMLVNSGKTGPRKLSPPRAQNLGAQELVVETTADGSCITPETSTARGRVLVTSAVQGHRPSTSMATDAHTDDSGGYHKSSGLVRWMHLVNILLEEFEAGGPPQQVSAREGNNGDGDQLVSSYTHRLAVDNVRTSTDLGQGSSQDDDALGVAENPHTQSDRYVRHRAVDIVGSIADGRGKHCDSASRNHIAGHDSDWSAGSVAGQHHPNSPQKDQKSIQENYDIDLIAETVVGNHHRSGHHEDPDQRSDSVCYKEHPNTQEGCHSDRSCGSVAGVHGSVDRTRRHQDSKDSQDYHISAHHEDSLDKQDGHDSGRSMGNGLGSESHSSHCKSLQDCNDSSHIHLSPGSVRLHTSANAHQRTVAQGGECIPLDTFMADVAGRHQDADGYQSGLMGAVVLRSGERGSFLDGGPHAEELRHGASDNHKGSHNIEDCGGTCRITATPPVSAWRVAVADGADDYKYGQNGSHAAHAKQCAGAGVECPAGPNSTDTVPDSVSRGDCRDGARGSNAQGRESLHGAHGDCQDANGNHQLYVFKADAPRLGGTDDSQLNQVGPSDRSSVAEWDAAVRFSDSRGCESGAEHDADMHSEYRYGPHQCSNNCRDNDRLDVADDTSTPRSNRRQQASNPGMSMTTFHDYKGRGYSRPDVAKDHGTPCTSSGQDHALNIALPSWSTDCVNRMAQGHKLSEEDPFQRSGRLGTSHTDDSGHRSYSARAAVLELRRDGGLRSDMCLGDGVATSDGQYVCHDHAGSLSPAVSGDGRSVVGGRRRSDAQTQSGGARSADYRPRGEVPRVIEQHNRDADRRSEASVVRTAGKQYGDRQRELVEDGNSRGVTEDRGFSADFVALRASWPDMPSLYPSPTQRVWPPTLAAACDVASEGCGGSGGRRPGPGGGVGGRVERCGASSLRGAAGGGVSAGTFEELRSTAAQLRLENNELRDAYERALEAEDSRELLDVCGSSRLALGHPQQFLLQWLQLQQSQCQQRQRALSPAPPDPAATAQLEGLARDLRRALQRSVEKRHETEEDLGIAEESFAQRRGSLSSELRDCEHEFVAAKQRSRLEREFEETAAAAYAPAAFPPISDSEGHTLFVGLREELQASCVARDKVQRAVERGRRRVARQPPVAAVAAEPPLERPTEPVALKELRSEVAEFRKELVDFAASGEEAACDAHVCPREQIVTAAPAVLDAHTLLTELASSSAPGRRYSASHWLEPKAPETAREQLPSTIQLWEAQLDSMWGELIARRTQLHDGEAEIRAERTRAKTSAAEAAAESLASSARRAECSDLKSRVVDLEVEECMLEAAMPTLFQETEALAHYYEQRKRSLFAYGALLQRFLRRDCHTETEKHSNGQTGNGSGGVPALIRMLAQRCGSPEVAFFCLDIRGSGRLSPDDLDVGLLLGVGIDHRLTTGLALRDLFSMLDRRNAGVVTSDDLAASCPVEWCEHGAPRPSPVEKLRSLPWAAVGGADAAFLEAAQAAANATNSDALGVSWPAFEDVVCRQLLGLAEDEACVLFGDLASGPKGLAGKIQRSTLLGVTSDFAYQLPRGPELRRQLRQYW